jgi:2-polyprenyl-6-methoxyphenol hydroxylase-like FAD-dependent oxidoreductase
MTVERFTVQCCIAGGGPAGMMAGLLLARAGVEVLVAEKHKDFLRDFRGDTIHPSTLDVLHELKIADLFLKLPHQKTQKMGFHAGGEFLPLVDFSQLELRYPFIAFIPQWDFLNFLAREAARFAPFNLIMEAEATDLIEENGRIAGVHIDTPGGRIEIRAELVIAADGRDSILREKAGLEVQKLGAPIDVLWFRLSRKPDDPADFAGYLGAGEALVAINRGDYWQCGFIIRKGGNEEIRKRGLVKFRHEVAAVAPFLRGRAKELKGWDDVKLLTVEVDRLVQWYRPGFLCIGDAAHAMSPVGGIGINLAIQDAVAASNIIAVPLRDGHMTTEHLRAVQHRRELPTRLTQTIQVFVQNRILRTLIEEKEEVRAPWPLRLVTRWPWLRRKMAEFVANGVRPEHVETRARRPPGM